jgi:patatin-like phospholipase/acyl hydrolase
MGTYAGYNHTSLNKPFKILSIDGGGIRGVIPARFLQLVEEQLDGQPIHEYFDLIVGTSTGGIIALAIGAGIPLDKVVNLYREKGKVIFSRRTPRYFFSRLPLMKISLPYTHSLYNNVSLRKELVDLFADLRMKDSRCKLCVPSVNITTGEPVVYKTEHHDDFYTDGKRLMWEVALATSSAPLFFPPFEMSGSGYHIDGGVWANNPSVVGIAEGIKLGKALSDIKVLSLGTGMMKFDDDKISKRFSGILGWRTHVVDISFQSVTRSGTNTSQYLIGKDNFVRPQIDAVPSECGMDDVAKLPKLLQYANELHKVEFGRVKQIFFTKE